MYYNLYFRVLDTNPWAHVSILDLIVSNLESGSKTTHFVLFNTRGPLVNTYSITIYTLKFSINQMYVMSHTGMTGEDDNPVRLYKDVHFRPAHPATCSSWALFPLLLPELRLRIWLLFLRRHRMIELGIRASNDEYGRQPRYYTNHKYLGNIISGRSYSLIIKGHDYAASLSPRL